MPYSYSNNVNCSRICAIVFTPCSSLYRQRVSSAAVATQEIGFDPSEEILSILKAEVHVHVGCRFIQGNVSAISVNVKDITPNALFIN